MPRPVRALFVSLLFLLLGGCVPGVSPGSAPAEKVLVFPGGWIAGRWVHQGSDTYSLPAPPLAADANGEVLGVLYPYSWQRYRSGTLESEVALPYPALRLHAWPAWVVVLERGIYTDDSGWLDYPARDAVNTTGGVYWVNAKGLWQGGRKLLDGSFTRVLAVGEKVLALDEQSGVYWPGEETIPLPKGWLAAAAASDLYLLTPAGLLRYDPAGYELGSYPGSFSDLAVSPDGDVWLAAANGGVIHLNAQLEEAW